MPVSAGSIALVSRQNMPVMLLMVTERKDVRSELKTMSADET